jgi:hypothetical protein
MSVIDLLVIDLREHIAKLRAKFLAPFLPPDPAHRPEDYEHDVKAACVLAHAALEEFVERVSMHVMAASVNRWVRDRKASDPLIALCLTHGVSLAVEADEEKLQKTCFDLLRAAIDEAKKRHSKSIQDNHGFSLKYLRAALTPVFINPPDDVRLTASLKTLTAARGSFAHSAARNAEFRSGANAGRASTPLSPEDAGKAIADCVTLCEQIAADAVKLAPQSGPVVRVHVPFVRKLQARGRVRRRKLSVA